MIPLCSDFGHHEPSIISTGVKNVNKEIGIHPHCSSKYELLDLPTTMPSSKFLSLLKGNFNNFHNTRDLPDALQKV